MAQTSDWFEDESFWVLNEPWMFPDEAYEKARSDLDAILERVEVPAGGHVLDLCCGPGRHSLELARRGYSVTAVDRTPYLLNKARSGAKAEGLEIGFFESDMRDYVSPGLFALALNLFTSFGYFPNPEDDRRVLENIFQSLQSGGSLVMDLMGKEILARIFQPRDWSERDGVFHLVEHTLHEDWGWLENRWLIIDGTQQHEWAITHRIYSGVELRVLLESCGFANVAICGDFAGAPYDQDAKRLVAFAQK